MSPTEIVALDALIREQGVIGDCQECGGKVLNVSIDMVTLVSLTWDRVSLTDTKGYPLLILTCEHCGFVKFHLLHEVLRGQDSV